MFGGHLTQAVRCSPHVEIYAAVPGLGQPLNMEGYPAKRNCNPGCGNKDSTFLARFLKHQRVCHVSIAQFIKVLAAGGKIRHVTLMITQSRWDSWEQHAPRFHRQCIPAEQSVKRHHDQTTYKIIKECI